MTAFYDYLDCSDVGFFCKKGKYLIVVAFDPKTGKKLETSFEPYTVEICSNEFQNKERGNKKAIRKRVLERLDEWRAFHVNEQVCPRLYDLVIGDDAGTTKATYLSMIRAYIIYKKWTRKSFCNQEFGIMDYCPFCGAKLPERLDDKLTEILQKEYGLNSWRDYKKAPKEFHTDEWWKKRGL